MKKIALAVMALLVSGCNAPAPPPAVPGSPRIAVAPRAAGSQSFDYYLLNLSWSPEFCYSHPSAAECAQHSSFVLHGLWPQRTDGSYPQDCSDAPGPVDPSQYSDIYPDASLLEHEWKTHGTCSGLSPNAFFGAARKAFRSFVIPPRLAQLTNQISMAPQQILSLVEQSNPGVPAESLAVSCGNNYLTAVEECLDTQLHPIACGPIRSCRANMVRIPPP
jgi:ribonuclease T2